MPANPFASRKEIHGWSLRWDDDRARAAHAGGWWSDETLAEVAARLARETPDRVLLVDGECSLDAGSLYARASNLAGALVDMGLSPGSVVSFMLPNWHEAAVIYLAATIAGHVAHPILPALRDSEVGLMLADTDSEVIFIPATYRNFDYPAMMERVNTRIDKPPKVVLVRNVGGAPVSAHFAYDALISPREQAPVFNTVDPDSVKMVLYTSGTSGRPKGVMHSHNSLYALVAQIRVHWHVSVGDSFLVPSPISHIGGSIYAFEFPILFGIRAILQDSWNAETAVAIMVREHVTHMAGATPFLSQLLTAAKGIGTRLPDLKVFICGGASVPPSLIREASGYFKNCIVSRVYGSTEVPVTTVGAMTHGDVLHAAETDGRIGIAEVTLTDVDGNPSGDIGEVRVKGPQMLVGYLRVEDEGEAFDQYGRFRMGDIARRVDEDYLVITGRAKDIIIRLGENIAPKEIEDILIEHPAIAEVAIVGLPDPRTGEQACAVIVPHGEAHPDVADLKAFLDDRKVARFKIPERVVIRTSLPRNAAGKVVKHQLKESLLAEAATKGL